MHPKKSTNIHRKKHRITNPPPCKLGMEVFFMSQNHSLEDLINNDARAYQFYFDQTPRVQTLLQMKDIRSFAEMAKAVTPPVAWVLI